MKSFFSYFGGAIAVSILLWYAWRIWKKRVEPQSSASWLMWTLLDAVILTCTIAAHKSLWLPLGYVIGALAVTLALFARGTWQWRGTETTCAIGVVVATTIWLTWSAAYGILAGVVAMTFAGAPLCLNLIRNPVRKTWPVWFFTAVACFFTLLGSDWSFAGTVLAWGGVAFDGGLTLVVLRPIKRS